MLSLYSQWHLRSVHLQLLRTNADARIVCTRVEAPDELMRASVPAFSPSFPLAVRNFVDDFSNPGSSHPPDFFFPPFAVFAAGQHKRRVIEVVKR